MFYFSFYSNMEFMKNKTYHIITIGCQMNKSDSERIAGYLEKYGYIFSENRDKADLVVVTTCGVRQSAEDRVYGLIPKIKKANKKTRIVLTGCLSQREDVRRRLEKYVDIWLPITQLENLSKQLRVKTQIADKNLGGSLGNYLSMAPKYKNTFSAFVPIGNGCDNFCAYCVVPHARGREVYRPAEEIIAEVESLVKREYKEIVLIAQNVNSYKSVKSNLAYRQAGVYKVRKVKSFENNIYFPDLFRMVNNIEGDFWIRFATSHPKDMSDELIKAIAECEKVCEHIHLPVQAGDNEVLRRMNRKYTREHYVGLIKKIRKNIPEASITTDVIIGFPGETKKQFEQTAKLFREVKFDMAYISQYSPRSGTASAKMKDDVEKIEKKRREEELMKILRKTSLANNKKYIGKTVEILVEGRGKDGNFFGKTRTGKQVRSNKLEVRNKNLIGEFVKVKIDKVKDFGLSGTLV